MNLVDVQFDVCVIGGGPTGSTIAHRLACLGHRVCLIEKKSFPRPHIGESLPPSIWPLLDELGVSDKIERSDFLRSPPARVRWGALSAATAQPANDLRGLQVDRAQFDNILLGAACAVGVVVLTSATPGRPRTDGLGDWRIPIVGEGRPVEIRARFLVDAAGRAGYLKLLRRTTAAKTLAICGYWQGVASVGNETLVEAGPTEWYWGAPLPDGTFNATVFLDPQRYLEAGRRGIALLYRELLAGSTLLAGCLRGRIVGSLRVCDATCQATADPVGENWIAVGESSFSIDPLSSQGVQTAIGSALTGAAVVNTLLKRPINGELAARFYRERHLESVRRHQRHAAEIYRRQAAIAETPFWQQRSEVESSPAPPVMDRRTLTPETIVLLAPNTQIVSTATLDENLVVSQPALMRKTWDRPVAFVGGVPIAALAQELRQPVTVENIICNWSRRQLPTPPRRLLEWLWNCGAIKAE